MNVRERSNSDNPDQNNDFVARLALAAGGAAGNLSIPVEGVPLLVEATLLVADPAGLVFAIGVDDLAVLNDRVPPNGPLSFRLRDGNDDLHGQAAWLSVGIGPAGTPIARTTTPTELAVVPRRKGFRVAVTPDDGVTARIWRLGRHARLSDHPLPSAELPCELIDLGGGGLRARILARGVHALQLRENDRFRIEVTAGPTSALLEGRLRYPKATQRDDAEALCGIRFVDADDLLARKSFQALGLILANLQRSAARRRAVA